MFSSSLKTKFVILLGALLALHFYLSFYLKGAFVDKGVDQVITESPLENLVPVAKLELTISQLFGLYDQQVAAEPEKPEPLENLFDSANKEFIGQIGNYQYILYATADVGGKLSAKLLVKDLDTNNVVLVTAKKGDFIANASVVDLALTELRLGSIGTEIRLKLFSKITPPAIAAE